VPDANKVSELTSQALDQFESTNSVSALVRQAHRIASLRHDYAGQVWFMLQVRDLTTSTKPDPEDLRALRGKLIALLGDDAGQREYAKQTLSYEATRERLDLPGKIHGTSVDQIETMLAQLERGYNSMDIPANLSAADAFHLTHDRNKAQARLMPMIGSLSNILSKVRQVVHDYLVTTEAELESGRTDSSFFDRVYARVNSLLNQYAPEAAEKFVAARERVTADDPEAISHALTSCRRMIKALADKPYPATREKRTGVDGVSRSMTDDAYRNRLLRYVQETVGKHKSGEVLQAVIADLGARLNALDELSSKGVHADPSLDEAHTCVIHLSSGW